MERNKRKSSTYHHNKRHDRKHSVQDGFMEHSRTNQSILPSPAILESYEEISPGIVEKLVDLVKQEQKHRQNLEIKYLKYIRNTTRFGQLLSCILAITIIYYSILAVSQDKSWLAITICICGFSCLTISNIIAINSNRHRGPFKANNRNRRPNFNESNNK